MSLKNPLHGLTRRRFVSASAAFAALSVISPWPKSWAGEMPAQGDVFMMLSRLITPVALSPQTGEQLYLALKQSDITFDANLFALGKIITNTPEITVESLVALLKNNQRQALLTTVNNVVAAWYTGIVGHRTYAYQSALMYQPTGDILSPPSYTHGGPLNWAHSTPPTHV